MHKPPSIRDLALAVGVSVATVSRALRGEPSVRVETRERILGSAAALGYEGNAYVSGLMSSLRKSQRTTYRGNLAFLSMTKSSGPAPGAGLGPSGGISYLRGVAARAEELGYSVTEYFLHEHEPRALLRILKHCGIRGIVLAPPLTHGKAHLRFPLEGFASVALGWGLLRPQLDTIRYDYYQLMRMALHHARKVSREGIGVVWDADFNRRADDVVRAAFLANSPDGPALAMERFFVAEGQAPGELAALCLKHKIRCLISNRATHLSPEVLAVVPQERVILYGEPPKEMRCYGWIDPQPALLGKWGVEQLVAKLGRHDYGVPEQTQVILVPPKWRSGSVV